MYQKRFYRDQFKKNEMEYFELAIKESDLFIGVSKATAEIKELAREKLMQFRLDLENYIKENPLFEITFKPFKISDGVPEIIQRMAQAAQQAGVGPMASVAGCLAEMVGESLRRLSTEVIVENGGDIYLASTKTRIIGVYAGDSKFNGKLSLEIAPGETPVGICSSSGTIGHSVSLGKADTCLVKSRSAGLADAYASTIGNMVRNKADLPAALEKAKSLPGLDGVLIVIENEMGVWGDLCIKGN
ncbi:MAG: UPF0280 family protein [bacterium]|nr:UPF0280 family protein [bacterium]MDD5353985.1 UPF0280 family protein [bacterium]MDD5757162.1 UPF0280 family protein [bacterium]